MRIILGIDLDRRELTVRVQQQIYVVQIFMHVLYTWFH